MCYWTRMSRMTELIWNNHKYWYNISHVWKNNEWSAQILKKAKLVLILWYWIVKFTSHFLWWAHYNIMLLCIWFGRKVKIWHEHITFSLKTTGDGAIKVLIKENKQSYVLFILVKTKIRTYDWRLSWGCNIKIDRYNDGYGDVASGVNKAPKSYIGQM